MARIIESFEVEKDTDFAILEVGQPSQFGQAAAGNFATSVPGAIALVAGAKYADLHVRLELWDSKPPQAESEWEDCDELPWEPSGEERLCVRTGFESPPNDGLTTTAMTRCRVQVLAWGRHRFSYGDTVPDDAPKERWLLRFWPDPENLDALAGPPRRIAGPLPGAVRPTPWHAAFRGWRAQGWSKALSGFAGLALLQRAMGAVGRPFQPDDLLAVLAQQPWLRWSEQTFTWDSPILSPSHGASVVGPDITLQDLATAAGLDELNTLADALLCLQRLGLVATLQGEHQGLLVPNGTPPRSAWDALPYDEETRRGIQDHLLREQVGKFEQDVEHLLTWAPEGTLRSTPESVARRLSTDHIDVIAALELHGRQRRFVLDFDGQLTPQSPFALRRTNSQQ